ncbi:MAG TPA: hypothetical protein VK518_23195 [Puia sp.]|nr:hypothetical protein [Puia sp.]
MPAQEKPNYLWSLFTMKCPRCRQGHMFSQPNAWNLRKTLTMPDKCPECGQPFELEVGFWYGTGYVSYGLSFALSAATFVAWWVLIGFSTEDHRFFWWMGLNAAFLVFMQPWLMRLSRVMYLYFFVSYDPDYKNTQVKRFE